MPKKQWVNLSGTAADVALGGKVAKKRVKKPKARGRTSDATWQSDEGVTSITYTLAGYFNQENPFGQEGFSLFDVPDATYSKKVGAPMLVREGVYVLIPDGMVFEKIETKIVKEEILPGEYKMLPVPADVPGTDTLRFEKDETIFSSDDLYPENPVEYAGLINLDGASCVHLYVYPFQYRPKSKQATALNQIDIKIYFTKSRLDSVSDSSQGRPSRFLNEILGNEQDIAKHSRKADLTEGKLKKRMLIITTEDLVPSLRKYEQAKQNTYNVSIVTKEEILPLYPSESSESEVEAIHSYIKAEDDRDHISYLILGGGLDKIPSKMLNIRKDGIGSVANDNYYCSKGDLDDPAPLFSLGRFPVSTADEMDKVVDLAISYNQFFNDKRKTAVFATCQKYDYNRMGGYRECTEAIVEGLQDDFTAIKCYDGECTQEELVSEIEKGAGFVNYRGHGTNTSWHAGNSFSIKDIEALNVGRNTPHVLNIACNNNKIQEGECLGSSWIKNLKAISSLGASCPSYTMTNHDFNKLLWEAINLKKFTAIGDIFFEATRALYRNGKSNPEDPECIMDDDCVRVNILAFLLLGDPVSDYMDDGRSK